MAPFWPTYGNFGQLFIPTSGLTVPTKPYQIEINLQKGVVLVMEEATSFVIDIVCKKFNEELW